MVAMSPNPTLRYGEDASSATACRDWETASKDSNVGVRILAGTASRIWNPLERNKPPGLTAWFGF